MACEPVLGRLEEMRSRMLFSRDMQRRCRLCVRAELKAALLMNDDLPN